jgi:predicted ATP-binding protein involved in virulence
MHNFRSFDQLTCVLGERLTVILGANGSGKSSILSATSIALDVVSASLGLPFETFKKTDSALRNGTKSAYTAVGVELTTGEAWGRTTGKANGHARAGLEPQSAKQWAKGVLEGLTQGGELPVYALYGVERAFVQPPLRRTGFNQESERLDALRGALQSKSDFKNAFKWFYNAEQDELRMQREAGNFAVQHPELRAVRLAISRMFPDLSDLRIDVRPLRFTVVKGGQRLGLDQLSDGYKTMLALVIDLASRFARANPQLDNPLDVQGVVLIDEVDLHVHPAWQRRVLNDLLRVFGQSQFVVTTHSPFVVERLNVNVQCHVLGDEVPAKFRDVVALSPTDLQVYHLNQGIHSLVDGATGFIQNELIHEFNELSREFSELFEPGSDY